MTWLLALAVALLAVSALLQLALVGAAFQAQKAAAESLAALRDMRLAYLESVKVFANLTTAVTLLRHQRAVETAAAPPRTAGMN